MSHSFFDTDLYFGMDLELKLKNAKKKTSLQCYTSCLDSQSVKYLCKAMLPSLS